MAVPIQNRRDTAANWTSVNPVLLEGQLGIELGSPSKWKIGDGTNHWNDLSYATGATGAGFHYSVATYGAVGNGSTDDAAAIQAAIDAAGAAGGGDVWFPALSTGYLVKSTLNLNKRFVRLVGEKGAYLKIPLASSVATMTDGVVHISANHCGVIGLDARGASGTTSLVCAADFIQVQGGGNGGLDTNPTGILIANQMSTLNVNGWVHNLGPGASADAPFGNTIENVRTSLCLGGIHVRGNTPTSNASATTVSNTFYGNCQGAECYFLEEANDITITNGTGSANVGAVAGLHIKGQGYYLLTNFDIGCGSQAGSMGSLIEANGAGQSPVVQWINGTSEQADTGSMITGAPDVTFIGVRHNLNNFDGSYSNANGATIRYIGCRFDNNGGGRGSTQAFDIADHNDGAYVTASDCQFLSDAVSASTFNSASASFSMSRCFYSLPYRSWGTNRPTCCDRPLGGFSDPHRLTPRGLATADMTANPGDLIECNTTSGPITISLGTVINASSTGVSPAPTASLICVKLTTLGGSNAVTLACTGSTRFNRASTGPTTRTLTLLNQAATVYYDAPNDLWMVLDEDLPLSALDARFAPIALAGTATWDPGSLAVGAGASTTVTVTGAVVGNPVSVGFSTAVPSGLMLNGKVTAANTVTVDLFNAFASTTDLASGTLTAKVFTS